MTAKDWTLLVIAAVGSKGLSLLQVQKTLFLLGENLTSEQRLTAQFYDFCPSEDGPVDRNVSHDSEELEREGLILIYSDGGSARWYIASPAGLEHASAIRGQLDRDVRQYLGTVVSWARAVHFDELVRTVYQAYRLADPLTHSRPASQTAPTALAPRGV